MPEPVFPLVAPAAAPGAPEEDDGDTPDEDASERSTAAMASVDKLLASWMAGLKLCAMAESVGLGLLSVNAKL